LHDFNPGILPSGLFWIVKVPDSAVQITDSILHIHLENVPEVDAFTFPPGIGNGITPFPVVSMKVSFDITYVKTGSPRRILATSHDPLSPFNWAGEMWNATNSGTFSMSYDDGSFSASGSFSSSGNFGEMGTERNGAFLQSADFDEAGAKVTEAEAVGQVLGTNVIEANRNSPDGSSMLRNAARLKGRLLQSGH
jgi:hypothetical protein